MIRQGRRQGRPCKGAIFSAIPAQGRPANTNLQGDKKFVDGGRGITVVHRGPKGIIGRGPSYFTELAWAAPVILRRGESSVLAFDLWQLALKPQELLTSDQGRINVARGPWQILARGPQTSPFPLFMITIEFKDTQKC
jgi:hypothetical protein